MKRNEGSVSFFGAAVCILVIVLTLSGCGIVAPAPTATPLPTSTPEPTATPLPPTATNTPVPTKRPTATVVPTPADVGDKVGYRTVEITVVKATTHDLIVPGGLYYYYPKDRANHTFLDLGVKVSDVGFGSPISVLWKDVQIREQDGNTMGPAFADTQTVASGTKFDPFKIGIATQRTVYESVDFLQDTYLRLIFVVNKHQTVLFTIEGSPRISINVQ